MNTNNHILTLMFTLSALVLALFISYIIFTVVKQQRAISKWQQARIAAEIQTLENERKRIAGDLHDELGPMLSAIKLQINHVEPSTEADIQILEKSSSQIDTIIQRFRDISYNLLPNTLVRKGFLKATEEFVGRINVIHPLKIDFTSDLFQLVPEKEVSLYRMVQEIIQNTIKHSKATTLAIKIHKQDNFLLLSTKDDGIGYHYEEKKQTGEGLGLMNMHSRAEVLGGQLKVRTQPSMGTHYELAIPL